MAVQEGWQAKIAASFRELSSEVGLSILPAPFYMGLVYGAYWLRYGDFPKWDLFTFLSDSTAVDIIIKCTNPNGWVGVGKLILSILRLPLIVTGSAIGILLGILLIISSHSTAPK